MLEETATDENLPNANVRTTLQSLLRRLWNCERFELERGSAKGDNYLGVVWRVRIFETSTPRSLILKLPPQNRVRRKQFFARPCFLRETLAYEHFLPLTQEFQAKHGIPIEKRFNHHAQCYGSSDVENDECIFLEDLCSNGYALHDRFAALPTAHVELLMRVYGKLHAVSLAMKQQEPARLRLCQSMVDIFEQRKEDAALGAYCEALKLNARQSLCAKQDAEYVRRLDAYFARGTFFELLLPLVNAANCEPYAVVCHGDCWNNNIMYQTTPELVVSNVRLIDWQLMRYASPVTDLAYFFFTCTTHEFRVQHFERMLDVYYEELTLHLTRLGANGSELFPRREFEAQLHEKFAVGLLLAMMVLPIVTMRGDDVPDLQAISEHIEAGNTTNLEEVGFLGTGNEAEYNRRMRGVILTCVDKDYI
ncbi:uncharacterized protein LOC115629698 [Scaptodrosophila lebanonensis]|uniref:Uncharacterized protein LOC115629698 n=1 Tax=Drosophila lebanonensis TaxID=7225 RepID=A0A6J2U4L2_DROLE|nr:uncharacterized protein LOC115629698 [Scaptodrosophila lebanonensis]